MKQKVLIIGPNYYNFLSATGNAFKRMSWDVSLCPYDNPIHPYTNFMKIRYKLSLYRDRLQSNSRMLFNEFALNKYKQEKPDLVFIMNGEILESKTLDLFRENSKVALWLFDSRKRLPLSVNHIDHVDALFCYEQEDVTEYEKEGKTAYFLPQACDTDTYKPLCLERDIDILFIGNLIYSPKRQSVTKAVIEQFPHKNIQIFGIYKPWYKGIIKWLSREYKSFYKNKTVSPEKANELYNRSKIVLNIHCEQQKNGANPRVFEICGSKSFQICDSNPYIDSLFSKGEIGIWHNTDELISLIKESLNSDTTDRANAAYIITINNHTFDNRLQMVVDIVYGNSIKE